MTGVDGSVGSSKGSWRFSVNGGEPAGDSGRIRLHRRLPSATVYPSDYGYVPSTLGRDGDPLDALVPVEEPTFPG